LTDECSLDSVHLRHQIAHFNSQKFRLRRSNAFIATIGTAQVQTNSVNNLQKTGKEDTLVGARHIQKGVTNIQHHLRKQSFDYLLHHFLLTSDTRTTEHRSINVPNAFRRTGNEM